MKSDEKEFLKTLQRRTVEDENIPRVRQVVIDIKINEKRAAYICEKWSGKGWYDYGVNVLAGWLTESGLKVDLTI